MNLFEGENNYSIEEINKYFETLDFVLNKSEMGFNYKNDEKNLRFFIPFVRSIQYIANFFDSRMKNSDFIDLKNEIEKIKENDPTNENTVKNI